MTIHTTYRVVSQKAKEKKLFTPPTFRIQYKIGRDTMWYFHEILSPIPPGITCMWEQRSTPWQTGDIIEAKAELERLEMQERDEEWVPVNHYLLRKK